MAIRRLIIIVLGTLLAGMSVSAQTAGERLAFVSLTRSGNNPLATVQVYDFASGSVINVSDTQYDSVDELTWSADGRLAFVGRRNYNDFSVQIWNGELTTVAEGAANYSDLTWSADGRLAFVGWRADGSNVLLWDGTALNPICSPSSKCSQPAWSGDGRLAYTSPDGAVYNFPCGDCDSPPAQPSGIVVWDAGKTITVVDPLATGSSARAPRWLDDGRLLFTLSDGEQSTLTAWDGDTLTPLTSAPPGAAFWSVDGNLATLSSPYGAGMINLDVKFNALSEPSAPWSSVLEGAGFVNGVTWSRDGRLSFSTEIDGDYGVFVFDGTNVISVAKDLGAYDESPAWSADGRLAFVSDRDNDFDLYVWDGQQASRLIALPDTDEDKPVWWMPSS